MTCPDTERLLEVVLGEDLDPAVQHHLRACPDCAATSRLVREMRAAYRPALHVPEELVDRRTESIIRQVSQTRSEQHETSLRDLAASAALALVTVVATVAATGSVAEAELWVPGVLGATAMAAAVGYELSLGRGRAVAGVPLLRGRPER